MFPSTTAAVGLFVALSVVGAAHANLSCLNNDGGNVDNWFMYKLPQLVDSKHDDVQRGMAFAYRDTRSRKDEFYIYDRPLDSEKDVALVGTLNSLAEIKNKDKNDDSDIGFIMYNDAPFKGDGLRSYGHTKGVLGFDEDGGFWIVHSTPKFPSTTGKSGFYFPENEIIYGQSFLCINLDKKQLEEVGEQLLLNRPNVYYQKFSSNHKKIYPTLNKVLNKEWDKVPRGNALTLVSRAGNDFVSFAKNKEWNDDLYSSLVAPYYEFGFHVETWRRQKPEPSYCPPKYQYPIVNVDEIELDGEKFSYTHDHSKIAIGLEKHIVCVGDINRMETQRNRGGGTVCFSNEGLWKALSAAVINAEECDSANQLAAPSTTPLLPTVAVVTSTA